MMRVLSRRRGAVLVLCVAAGLVTAPTATATAGSGVSHVTVPPDSTAVWTIVADWSGASIPSVPSDATTVEITLPLEVQSLRLDGETTVWAESQGYPATHPQAVTGQQFVTVDLAALSADWTAATPATITVVVERVGGPGEDVLDLAITIPLGAPAGPAPASLALDLYTCDGCTAPATDLWEYSYDYDLGQVGAAPGMTLAITGYEEFWSYGGMTITADLAYVDVSAPATVLHHGLAPGVSVDGTKLTLTLPTVDPGDGIGTIELRGLEITTTIEGTVWTKASATFRALPSDAVEAYVVAVYSDLFNRVPDPTGLAGWSRALRNGVPYSAVADAITGSREFRAGLITDAYRWYLGREPDPAGLAGWLNAMDRGVHIQQMEAGFLGSNEYYTAAGTWYPDTGSAANAWITALYVDVLGRAPGAAEVTAWVAAMGRSSRYQIAMGFLYSTEYLTGVVDGYYQWLLHRHLDPAGRVGWVRAIQNGTRTEVIIAGIIASTEYRSNVPTAPTTSPVEVEGGAVEGGAVEGSAVGGRHHPAGELPDHD